MQRVPPETSDPETSDATGEVGAKSLSMISDAMLNSDVNQYIGFVIDGRRYAFPIHQIREIVILTDITPVPQVARCVDGVANLRGSVIPVVSLRSLLGAPQLPADKNTRTIVVNVGRRTIGCTVDSVTEVLRISNDQIQATPEAIAGGETAFIDGLVKLEDQLVILLNVDRLLDENEFSRTHS